MNQPDKALEILQLTTDGEDLSPYDLNILQAAVNGNLNEKGVVYFDELHEKVKAGTYQRPWLCDVEHMTVDHRGYVYYKGNQVEHYTVSAFESHEAMTKDTQRVAEVCAGIEAAGKQVNGSTYWKALLEGAA